MTTAQAIATAVTGLSETLRQPLSKTAAEAYRMALEDLAPEQVSRAYRRALREPKFMPSHAELRELAGAGGPRETER